MRLSFSWKTHVAHLAMYACTIWGCSNANIIATQWLPNQAARIISSNFDIINVRGGDLVKQLKWQTMSQRIDYYLET